MKYIIRIIRILVGGLFVFSGFVKLVDPLGSAYKFEEYFGADVLNLEFLIPLALPFAIVLILLELLLGVALLIGFKTKLTLWSLFGITLFFLFLTWYSAEYDKVTDCGCFGDAVKLSPWETFYKNVVFIVWIVFLIFFQKHITPIFRKSAINIILLLTVAGSIFVLYKSLAYLPIIDFRPYAEGKNIREGMLYNDDGEIPPVHDFYLYTETDEVTDAVLDAPKAMLIIMNELEHTPEESWTAIKNQILRAKANGYLVYGLSSSSSALVKQTIIDHKLPLEILFCDATTIKTMCRANPGVIELNKATVVAKYSWKDIK